MLMDMLLLIMLMDMMDPRARARHYRGQHLLQEDLLRAMPPWLLLFVAGVRGLVVTEMPLVDLQQILQALGRGPQMKS